MEFDREHLADAWKVEVVGQRALGQEGVGGDGLTADVEGIEDRDDHPDLVGLLDRFATVDDGQHADFILGVAGLALVADAARDMGQ